MKKTYDIIDTYKDKLNFIIQVIDARAISFSSNLELINEFQNHAILNIALKADLADLSNVNLQQNSLLILDKNNNHINKLLTS
ncbi:hypothetical protein IKS57_00245 [bacterium]|nr:hypothetical protein [bacterium]